MRSGDVVQHRPSGEEWLVAFVEGNRLAYCGWPEGQARTDDCSLVRSCSDEEHVNLLVRMAKIPSPDARGIYARNAIENLPPYLKQYVPALSACLDAAPDH